MLSNNEILVLCHTATVGGYNIYNESKCKFDHPTYLTIGRPEAEIESIQISWIPGVYRRKVEDAHTAFYRTRRVWTWTWWVDMGDRSMDHGMS